MLCAPPVSPPHHHRCCVWLPRVVWWSFVSSAMAYGGIAHDAGVCGPQTRATAATARVDSRTEGGEPSCRSRLCSSGRRGDPGRRSGGCRKGAARGACGVVGRWGTHSTDSAEKSREERSTTHTRARSTGGRVTVDNGGDDGKGSTRERACGAEGGAQRGSGALRKRGKGEGEGEAVRRVVGEERGRRPARETTALRAMGLLAELFRGQKRAAPVTPRAPPAALARARGGARRGPHRASKQAPRHHSRSAAARDDWRAAASQ